MRRLAWLLGVLALVSVVGVSTLALIRPGLAPGETGPAAPAGHELTLSGGRALMPDDWHLTRQGTVIRYADPRGRVTAQVAQPAVLDPGFCPVHASGTPRGSSSSRAFAGFLHPRAGNVAAVARQLAQQWADAVSLDPRTGRREAVRLTDTTPHPAGRRADAVVEVPPGRCHPPRARVCVVALSVDGGVVPFVLVRDVGSEGALPTAVAERILASVRAS